MNVKEGLVTLERTWNVGEYESFTAGCSIWFDFGEGDLSECKQVMRTLARQNVQSQYKKLNGVNLDVKVEIPEGVKVTTVSVTLSKRVNLGDYEGAKVSYTDWADIENVVNDTPRLWKGVWANLNDEVAQLKGEESTETNFGAEELW